MQRTLPFMPQPKRWHKPVAWLLWLANSDAPSWYQHRFAFYQLKDKILEFRALDDGIDWQLITHDCWTCYGTGYYTYLNGEQDICNRCYGSGVHFRRYIKLHRLLFGGRVFHRPGASQCHPPDTEKELIRGRIRHERKGWRAIFAFGVLLALFDRPKLWRLFRVVMREQWQRGCRKIARHFPTKCHECGCLLIRKDAGSTLSGYGFGHGVKVLGVLCRKCSDRIPF